MDKVVAPYRRQVAHNRKESQAQEPYDPNAAAAGRGSPEEEKKDSSEAMIDTTDASKARDDEEFLTYILKPMNLDLVYEHEVSNPNKSIKISIKLDELQLAMQH